jgi:UDP-glucose 4-epimerase
VRDFIHVQDLCDAHLLALESLRSGGNSQQFNLGNGQGFSVQQVIDCAQGVTGREVKVVHEDRREGDPAVLVADATLAKKVLGWQPGRSDLEKIIATAWNWERSFFSH